MTNMPATQPVLTDPAGGAPWTLGSGSDGRSHPQHHKDLNDELEGTASLVGNTTGPGAGTHEAKIRRRTSPSLITTDDFADVADENLSVADSLTGGAEGNWGAAGLVSGFPLAADTAIKTQGTASITANLSTPNNSLVAEMHCSLPADHPVGAFTHVLMDIRRSNNQGGGGDEAQWDKFAATLCSATALGGTRVTKQLTDQVLPAANTFYTVAIPVGALTIVRSFGITRIDDSGSSGRSIQFHIDNIRFAALSAKQVALGSAATVGVVVPPSYATVVSEQPAPIATTKTLIDLRPFNTIISRFGGVRYLREWDVDETGVTDISPSLRAAIAATGVGGTLKGSPGAIYRMASGVSIVNTHQTVDFGTARVIAPMVDGPLFTLSGKFPTLRGVRAFGNRSVSYLGSLLKDVAGSSIVGTTTLLNALNNKAKVPGNGTNESNGEQIYGRNHLGQIQVDFTLSQTTTLPLDCTVVIDNLQGTTHLTQTITVAQSTPTVYSFVFQPIDLLDRTRIQIFKATAGANAITVHSYRLYSEYGYPSGFPYHAGAFIGASDHALVEDCIFEGMGGDAVSIAADVNSHAAHVNHLISRACKRQGVFVGGGSDAVIENFLIMAGGQADLDVEPHKYVEEVRNLTVRYGTLALGAAENWSNNLFTHNKDGTIDHVDFIRDSTTGGSFIAQAIGWRARVTHCRFRLIHGASPSGGGVAAWGKDCFWDDNEFDVPTFNPTTAPNELDINSVGQTADGNTFGTFIFHTTPLDPPITTLPPNDRLIGPIIYKNALLEARKGTVWIAAEDLEVEGGAGAASQGTAPDVIRYVTLTDGATQGVFASFLIPRDAVSARTFSVRPVWSPLTTDAVAHTVRWSMNVKSVVGSDIDAAGTTVAWTGDSAARTADVAVRETGQASTGLTVSTPDYVRLSLRRLGADALDTLGSDIRLLGIHIDYASTG